MNSLVQFGKPTKKANDTIAAEFDRQVTCFVSILDFIEEVESVRDSFLSQENSDVDYSVLIPNFDYEVYIKGSALGIYDLDEDKRYGPVEFGIEDFGNMFFDETYIQYYFYLSFTKYSNMHEIVSDFQDGKQILRLRLYKKHKTLPKWDLPIVMWGGQQFHEILSEKFTRL